MAIMMMLEWTGVTLEQYDELRRLSRLEDEKPEGGLYHVAAHDGTGIFIVDTWESEEAFNAFVQERLMPAVEQAGITSEPRIRVLPAYNIFAFR